MRDTPKPELDYITKTMNQFQARTVDDCVWYATNEATERVTRGAAYVKDPEAFRKQSTGTISGPSKLSVVSDAFLDKFPGTFDFIQSPIDERLTKDQAIARLVAGATIVVLGDYEKLPKYYRRWTNNDRFDHATTTTLFNPDHKLYKGSQGSTWFYDPLGGGPSNKAYRGEWIDVESVFDDFAWHTGTAISIGVFDQYTEEIMITVHRDQTAPRLVTIKAGTEVMKEPSAASKGATKFKNQVVVPYVGHPNADWHAILTKVDNAVALKIAYVHKSRVTKVEEAPVVPTDPQLKAENEALKKQVLDLGNANKVLQGRVDTANGRLGKIDKEAVKV